MPLLGFAQSVSYTYRPLAAEGCNVRYSVAKQDSSYYIVVTIRSDRFKFLSESTMLIRTFKDEVIKLEGKHIDSVTVLWVLESNSFYGTLNLFHTSDMLTVHHHLPNR